MARVLVLSVLFLVFTIFQALTSARSPLPPFPGELSKGKLNFEARLLRVTFLKESPTQFRLSQPTVVRAGILVDKVRIH